MTGKHLQTTLVLLGLLCAPAEASSIFVGPVPGDSDSSRALTSAIETAILKTALDANVVTPRALDSQLEIDLAKACVTDGDDAACVVNFAQALGVDYVVQSRLGRLGDLSLLTIAIYDGKKAGLLAQGVRRAPSHRPDVLLDGVDGLVAELALAANLRVADESSGPPPVAAYAELSG